MQITKLLTLSSFLLFSSVSLADKPSWAGNGEKPSKYEKEYHKENMTSKNEYKKAKQKKEKYKKEKHNKDRDYDRNQERYEKEYGSKHDSHRSYDGRSGYEGQGQSDGEFIERKTDETKKNWIGKFFDFLN